MKIKTSLAIDERLLEQIKAIAASEERSVSYVLEKFIGACIEEKTKAASKIVRPSVDGGGRPGKDSTIQKAKKKKKK